MTLRWHVPYKSYNHVSRSHLFRTEIMINPMSKHCQWSEDAGILFENIAVAWKNWVSLDVEEQSKPSGCSRNSSLIIGNLCCRVYRLSVNLISSSLLVAIVYPFLAFRYGVDSRCLAQMRKYCGFAYWFAIVLISLFFDGEREKERTCFYLTRGVFSPYLIPM